MRVYKTTDRIKIKVEDVTIEVAPLTYGQRREVAGQLTKAGGATFEDQLEMIRLATKYAVKNVIGLEDSEGPYQVTFTDDNTLSDESLDDLANIPGIYGILSQATMQLATAGPFIKLTDGEGKDLEGVEVILPGNSKGGKSKK